MNTLAQKEEFFRKYLVPALQLSYAMPNYFFSVGERDRVDILNLVSVYVLGNKNADLHKLSQLFGVLLTTQMSVINHQEQVTFVQTEKNGRTMWPQDDVTDMFNAVSNAIGYQSACRNMWIEQCLPLPAPLVEGNKISKWRTFAKNLGIEELRANFTLSPASLKRLEKRIQGTSDVGKTLAPGLWQAVFAVDYAEGSHKDDYVKQKVLNTFASHEYAAALRVIEALLAASAGQLKESQKPDAVTDLALGSPAEVLTPPVSARKQQASKDIHSDYFMLIGDICDNEATSVLWQPEGLSFTAEELADEVHRGTAYGKEYAQKVLRKTLALADSSFDISAHEDVLLDVSLPPRIAISAVYRQADRTKIVWTTVAYEYTAEKMASMIDERSADGLELVYVLLRLAMRTLKV